MDSVAVSLSIPAGVDRMLVAGPSDSLLRAAESATSAALVLRGDMLKISGEPGDVELLTHVFSEVFERTGRGEALCGEDIDRLVTSGRSSGIDGGIYLDDTILMVKGKALRPKTEGQRRYLRSVREHTMTFCLGPAGTGKTYLAMAMAVAALRSRDVGRIVLTRPVVEAGENLGFLPGTLEEKVDPYVRPLYDALFDLEDSKRVHELVDRGVIEIAPLAYMRGRTLNDAFVIVDEAQNTTPGQMKMLLTRLGFNSKFVITGDASQRDLPGGLSGLAEAERVLRGIDDIAFVHLDRTDVVRHRLVGQIVEAYDAYDAKRKERGNGRTHQ